MDLVHALDICNSVRYAQSMNDDEPSHITLDGTMVWRDGNIHHREDGPALIYKDGTKVWMYAGKYHRVDGPAVERSDGTQEWFFENERHRQDGPALICVDGSQFWYLHDKPHRQDGPAVIHIDGSREWWIDGEKIDIVVAIVGGHKIIFTNDKSIEWEKYPSWEWDSDLNGLYMDEVDLTLFMLSHEVVEMPYE